MALRTKSARKKQRQSLKKRAKNNYVKSTLRTKIKEFHSALAENDIAKAEEKFKAVVVGIDKAASKGILHKNTASRHISRLSKYLHRKKAELQQG